MGGDEAEGPGTSRRVSAECGACADAAGRDQSRRQAPAVAMGRSGVEATDEAMLAERAGHRVHVVEGDAANVKITTAGDLDAARRAVAPSSTARIGTGYDLHRLIDGRPLILGGVTVPSEKGATGHSDADAAFHAITDAILGTIAAGDIGSHFPPSDERWRDADSAVFLRHAVELLAGKGGRIENVDLVIVCERPKISPYREAMARRTAEVLGITVDRVGIKATTSEGLGFTGRGEGIAAQAVVSVAMGG